VSDEKSDTPPANPPGEELLRFPTDYPIKVVGRPSAEFRARIHAVVLKHVPNVETDRITERLSENGNFLSISYTIVAESREQVVALARDLTAAEGVLMVI
jgi:putative lipoic acid-binding regulatory protein